MTTLDGFRFGIGFISALLVSIGAVSIVMLVAAALTDRD